MKPYNHARRYISSKSPNQTERTYKDIESLRKSPRSHCNSHRNFEPLNSSNTISTSKRTSKLGLKTEPREVTPEILTREQILQKRREIAKQYHFKKHQKLAKDSHSTKSNDNLPPMAPPLEDSRPAPIPCQKLEEPQKKTNMESSLNKDEPAKPDLNPEIDPHYQANFNSNKQIERPHASDKENQNLLQNLYELEKNTQVKTVAMRSVNNSPNKDREAIRAERDSKKRLNDLKALSETNSQQS